MGGARAVELRFNVDADVTVLPAGQDPTIVFTQGEEDDPGLWIARVTDIGPGKTTCIRFTGSVPAGHAMLLRKLAWCVHVRTSDQLDHLCGLA